jgi:hypothetical protein
MAGQSLRCANSECNFAVDGRCVEGFALEECPHVSTLDVDDIEEVEEAEPRREDEARVLPLALGEALARRDASSLQRRRPSCAIGIVAPNDAGKTSLIASVYDLLQTGPIDGIGFAGSSTLIGFEKVCHDARTSSRRGMPHTERTSAGADATFFHLDLRPMDGDVLSLFIADRSGEDYLAVADDLARSAGFFELRRADVLTVLVNGEHLADSAQRHETKAVTPQMVGALVEAGSIRRGCRLAIVLTKQDVVLASPHAARVEADFGELVDGIVEDLGTHFAKIERFAIAASPRDVANVQRGQGVDRLLRFWLRPGALPQPALRHRNESTRLIDLLDFAGGTK